MDKLALVRTRRHQNLNQHWTAVTLVLRSLPGPAWSKQRRHFEIQKFMVTTLRMRDNRSTPAP